MSYYDCIVVGLGPAGSTVLRDLGLAGVRALGIDQAVFPRYKPCGGALSAAAQGQLHVPGWKQTVETELHTVRIALKLGRELTHSTEDPICQFVMRDRFDHLLVEAAAETGVEVRDDEPLLSLELAPPGVIVSTPNETFKARCLVGCDGAHSLVARTLGLSTPESGAAIEAEIAAPEDVVAQWADQVYVSYASPPWGYGWVFPKRHGLSVGVGSFAPRNARLPLHLDRFLAHCELDKYPKEVSGHPIPTGGKRSHLHQGPVCLAGDAASLCDPLSGEGISHALLSGHIAARHVIQYLDDRVQDFSGYQEEIDEKITADLALARWIAGKLYRAPRLFFWLLERNPQTIALYFRLIAGGASYSDVVDHLRAQFARFGLFGVLSHNQP